MIVGPLAGWLVIIVPGDLADRPEVRIAFRYDDDVALAHAAAESPDLGDIAAVALGAGLDLVPLVEDRLVLFIPGIGPVDLSAPTEHDIAALDRGIVDMVFGARPTERHLEELAISEIKTARAAGALSCLVRQGRDFPKDAFARFQPESASLSLGAVCVASRRPKTLDEVFIGVGLVESDEADLPRLHQGVVSGFKLFPAGGNGSVAEPDRLLGRRESLAGAGGPVKNEIGWSCHGRSPAGAHALGVIQLRIVSSVHRPDEALDVP